jgi:hypothetical protein
LRNTNETALGHLEEKVWLADIWCSAPPWHKRALLEHFNLELFDHHPHSPDLSPSDYHLFTYLNNWLGSQNFNNNKELMEGVKRWLSSQAHRLTRTYTPIWQKPQFWRWLGWEVAQVCMYF